MEKMSLQELAAIFTTPRHDGPGRKGVRPASPPELEIEQNPPGCIGIRNPPKAVEDLEVSDATWKAAEKRKAEAEAMRNNIVKKMRPSMRKRLHVQN